MKNVIKLFILLIRNSSIFDIKGFRGIRWFLYRTYFDAPKLKVSDRVVISKSHTNDKAFFKCIGNTEIGADVYIDYSGGVTCKNNVAIGRSTKIFTHNHTIHDEHKDWKQNSITFSPLLIEDYVIIGTGVIVLPSVTLIAEGSIIGAGAVLTKNTTPYGVYAGNPAKKITTRRISK